MKFTSLLFFVSKVQKWNWYKYQFQQLQRLAPSLHWSALGGEGKDSFALRSLCSKNGPESVVPFHWLGTNLFELEVFQIQHFLFAEIYIPILYFQ